MFCPNCGKELDNNAKFCDSCGKALNDTVAEINLPLKPVQDSNTYNSNVEDTGTVHSKIDDIKSQISFTDKTKYAGTSFWCSIIAFPLSCCCVGPLLGIPATIFGVLAIKNKEADAAKAWIGVVLGGLETIFVIIFIIAMIRNS